MSSSELDKALDVLKRAGHKIGTAYVRESRTEALMVVPIDDLPRTFDEVYKMAAEENRKPRKAERTGDYVQLKVVPRSRRGTLGEAIIENGHLEYLFQLDERFDVRGAPLRPFYVPESDIETCKRPTDDEVRAINKLTGYGS